MTTSDNEFLNGLLRRKSGRTPAPPMADSNSPMNAILRGGPGAAQSLRPIDESFADQLLDAETFTAPDGSIDEVAKAAAVAEVLGLMPHLGTTEPPPPSPPRVAGGPRSAAQPSEPTVSDLIRGTRQANRQIRSHESRYVWAVHVVHHSSEHYNLSTALRQPVADSFTATIPYGVLALMGFRPDVIETAQGVNLLYQFWVHTEAIKTIGPAEKVFNSPSLHRVHHGSNRQYLDRNHGSILIIWDRLFGTHEVENEEVVYGLTRNLHSYNPARIATHEYADMLRDVRGATTWRDRLSYVFRGPGWAYTRRAETEPQAEALPVDLPEPVAAGVA